MLVMELVEGKNSDEVLRAQSLLWTLIFSHIDSMALKCAIELGIPDAICSHGKHITLSMLLSALSISPAKASHMRRLMRMLTHSGIFARTRGPSVADIEEDVYSLTPLSRLLVRNKDVSLSGFAAAMLHPVVTNPFQSMSAWFKSDEATPFSFANGCGLWAVTDRNPGFNKAFNDGTESDTKFLMDVLIKDCGHVFKGIESLVDVGGGTGAAVVAISEAFPNLKCSVLELPQVAKATSGQGVVDIIAGDMFDYIPPTDAILLKWILHDWNDEKCVKILKRCKEAISGRREKGKIIIIELVMGANNSHPEATISQLYMDMLMLVNSGGAERDEQEWRKIFIKAGFKNYKITPALGLRSVIEVYP